MFADVFDAYNKQLTTFQTDVLKEHNHNTEKNNNISSMTTLNNTQPSSPTADASISMPEETAAVPAAAVAPGAPMKKKRTSSSSASGSRKKTPVARRLGLDEVIILAAEKMIESIDHSYQLVLGHKEVITNMEKTGKVVDCLDKIKSVMDINMQNLEMINDA